MNLNGDGAAEPEVGPMPVPPSPVPLMAGAQVVQTGPGQMMVAIIFQTPIGSNVFFLNADTAKAMAEDVLHKAYQARKGLIVP